ncbi:hypothetical protein ACOSP7_029852 [Xanthoceras sorbifolium]
MDTPLNIVETTLNIVETPLINVETPLFNRRTSASPPPPKLSSYSNRWNFEMLPKGVPIPPSGPSRRNSTYPPPPGLSL